jgi:hypothetical protein
MLPIADFYAALAHPSIDEIELATINLNGMPLIPVIRLTASHGRRRA